MKYVCLVYLVEKDMNEMTKRESDACVDESLAYDDALRKTGHLIAAHAPAGRGGDHIRAERQSVRH